MNVKKIIVSTILLTVVMVGIAEANRNPGNIWAVHSDGAREDYFNLGEDVFLEGQNLKEDWTYLYCIFDKDERSSAYQQVLKSGYVDTNSMGYIPPQYIWTIPKGDFSGHDYRVDLVINSSNGCDGIIKAKRDTFYSYTNSIPEFGTVVIPAAIAIGAIFLTRRR